MDNYILQVVNIFEVQMNVKFFLLHSAGFSCYILFNNYLFSSFNIDISILFLFCFCLSFSLHEFLSRSTNFANK